MIIPGWLISIITFPGVIVHEIGHRFFCDISGVPVYDICYFRFGKPAGFVLHGEVKGIKNPFLISVGPLIMNTILCMFLTFPIMFPTFILEAEDLNLILVILAWVGFSIGMHAFPSNDAMNMFIREVRAAKRKGVLYFVAIPFTLFIRLANILSFIWFDLVYAAVVSLILPLIVLL